MRKAWDCLTYVQSDLSLTVEGPSVFTVRFIIIGDEPPSAQLIADLVGLHTRNGEPLLSEMTGIEVPDELVS